MQVRLRQRGVSLIEVLVAVLVFSIGLIGLAGLVVMSTRSTHVGYLRTQATFLANNMAERMSANPAAVWTKGYDSTAYPVSAGTVGCDATAPCDAAGIAVHDQQIWSAQLKAFLPNPKATIACTDVTSVTYNPSGKMAQRPPYGGNCAMTISWTERGAGDQTHRSGTPQIFAWNFQP
ncbi:MAG TPA: type IV pilus modification protein PilV [Rhodanobacter sp.]|jgi:type IV pilus assembly protein PilV|nr:type IV pilus modification protein PilV [Rhodanobacter sp.]